MKPYRIKLSIILFISISISGLHAQESIPSTGGKATGNGGNVSWTVGQVFCSTNMGENASIAEGVQQPFEISVVTAIEEAKGIALSIQAYPNPATDYLNLEVSNIEVSDMHFQLFDMHSKVLHTEKITDKKTKIYVNKLVSGYYHVKISQKGNELKTFKIIKR